MLHRLGQMLRESREAAKLTQGEVAERLAIGISTMQRIEAGAVRPRRINLLALLDFYQVTGPARDEMLALAKEPAKSGWLHSYELPSIYATFIAFEGEAAEEHGYESQLVPGLLQTEAYADAAIAGNRPTLHPEDRRSRVEVRMQRKAALTKARPLHLWSIIDEAVLHREVGGPAVMAQQLRTLVDEAEKPNIQLQVIQFSAGSHPGMTGSFVVMNFADPRDPVVVYIENRAGDLFLEKPEDVKRYAADFDHLRAMALNPADSSRLIAEQAERYAAASKGRR